MTIDWRRRTLRAPQYVPDVDLVAVVPDGRLAACCVCWLNGDLDAGQVEPLGVHPAFQRLGLGRAVLHEGLRRMRRQGAATAYVDAYGGNDPARHLTSLPASMSFVNGVHMRGM